jgi:putative ABC transport system permease protein
VLSGSLGQPRAYTLLMSIFALLAVGLAAVGLYGVVSYTVTQRTHEMGIHMALGARRAEVFRLVLSQGLTLSVAGIAIGLVGALAAGRVLTSLIASVRPGDPLTLSAAAGLLLTAALVATFFPARRATKVDPATALRHE